MTTDTDTKTSAPAPGTGHEGRTFLVGEHVYLRTVEDDDAKVGMAWRGTRFPKSSSNSEKFIEEELKDHDTLWLLIVRKSDDRVVGSLQRDTWAQCVFWEWFADPIFGTAADAWIGEAAAMALQWTVDERHMPISWLEGIPADREGIWQALESVGARRAMTFTNKVKRGDTWMDEYVYEYLNAAWVERLGDPADAELERSGTGEPRPVVAPVAIEGPLPPNAIRVGPRVYLRPLEKKDAAVISEWARKETEPFWDNGRSLRTTVAHETWFNDLQKNEPQTWVRFAVCLRETDEFIGCVGVDGIDYINKCGESESEFHRVDYRGGGYGSEAKHLLFDYAFNTLGLHTLQSWVMFGNTRSAAALRKQGYREVGREHWLVQKNGQFENFVVFELMADEWRNLPRE